MSMTPDKVEAALGVPANKMPEMPEAAFRLMWKRGAYYVDKPEIGDTDVYTADQMRTMYLAGLEAARQAVPAESDRTHLPKGDITITQGAATVFVSEVAANGWDVAIKTTLSNLTALVKEAQK